MMMSEATTTWWTTINLRTDTRCWEYWEREVSDKFLSAATTSTRC